MTREEAITVLKAFMKNPLFSEVHKAAFNIAIHDIKAYQDWNINNLILVNKDNYEPTTKNDLGVEEVTALTEWIEKLTKECEDAYNKGYTDGMKALEQEPILEKVNKMKSEIADSLEFWDYSPNNNPLARDILETLTNFWGNIREVKNE